jgi:Asp-tRNA(Asn)/Glu-tRNA(Gln) amidotransferase B subunit
MKSLQKISGKIAKEFLPELLEKGGSPAKIVDERGLSMISDPTAISVIGEELLTAHLRKWKPPAAVRPSCSGSLLVS